jgi:hypothetical protein
MIGAAWGEKKNLLIASKSRVEKQKKFCNEK